MFDTHCHLNFKAFKKNLSEVVKRAQDNSVKYILIPGTDIKTSKKALEIAGQFDFIYTSVGIHPHHVYDLKCQNSNIKCQNYNSKLKTNELLNGIEQLLQSPKVVAVGEVGLDRHPYQKTQYEDYKIDEKFIDLQKELLIKQIKLAVKHNKSLILHNREAVDDILEILNNNWDEKLSGKTVFHCCEPEEKLLEFAKEHKIFIGVDGDITYDKKKQEFIKKVPLELLVLETDSPFLLPEPLKSQKKFPNEPANLKIILKFIANILNMKIEELDKVTTANGIRLF